MTDETRTGLPPHGSLLPPPPPPVRTAAGATPPPDPQGWPAVVAEVTRQGDRQTAAIVRSGQPALVGQRIGLGLKSPVLVLMASRAMPLISEAVRKVYGDGWTVEPCLSADQGSPC